MEWNEIVRMFIAGITLGSGPCLLTCLPILLPYITAKGTDLKTGFKLTIIFSLSRLISYSLLGLLAVAAFRIVDNILGLKGVWIKLIAGAFIVLIGLTYLIGKIPHISCSFLHKYLIEKSNWNMFILGLLIGFSPCPPLMSILTYLACMSNNLLWGFIGGLSFGLGTVISPLIPAGAVAGLFSYNVRKSAKLLLVMRIICGLVLIYFGLRLIFIFKTFYF